MARPQLWLLAGGNGAGKSTFYNRYLAPRGLRFVNADEIARMIAPNDPMSASYEAAGLGEEIRTRLLQQRESFCFETVFSHPSKIDFAARARALDYEIVLVFIHLTDASLNQARVAHRVRGGGHDVPADKVASRIPRTLEHIRAVFPLCDRVDVLDNSSAQEPYRRVFTLQAGRLTAHQDPLPGWALALLETQAGRSPGV
jgi:predicted ABC-type ATPase